MFALITVHANRTIIVHVICIGLAHIVKQRALFQVVVASMVKILQFATLKTELALILTSAFAMLIIMVQHVKLRIALENYPILALFAPQMAHASWQTLVLARLDFLARNVKHGTAMELQEMHPMFAPHTDNVFLLPIAGVMPVGLVMIVIHRFALTRLPIPFKHVIMAMEVVFYQIPAFVMLVTKVPSA